eukprot:TRINITY_DN8479_c0_g2_i3.p1 TRINITY_DN8479_c0_g2~~TRINITY_DN8479_c0_g2_i3.p1  ORF type:complete len:116 (-),score=27.68 TRINITY_DN8479_c0_g2_i3:209-556(-)
MYHVHFLPTQLVLYADNQFKKKVSTISISEILDFGVAPEPYLEHTMELKTSTNTEYYFSTGEKSEFVFFSAQIQIRSQAVKLKFLVETTLAEAEEQARLKFLQSYGRQGGIEIPQ